MPNIGLWRNCISYQCPTTLVQTGIYGLVPRAGSETLSFRSVANTRARMMAACSPAALAGDRRAAWAEVLAQGYEGLVAKDLASPYVGGRTLKWLKVKQSRYPKASAGGRRGLHGLTALDREPDGSVTEVTRWTEPASYRLILDDQASALRESPRQTYRRRYVLSLGVHVHESRTPADVRQSRRSRVWTPKWCSCNQGIHRG